MQYEGVDKLQIRNRDSILKPSAEVKELSPYSYQTGETEERKWIGYVLDGKDKVS